MWNAYADEHGGKHVKTDISTVDAMNSIATYSVREAQEKAQAEKEALQKDDGETAQEKPEMGV